MESRIVELRQRGRRTVDRSVRLALIGAGVAAGTLIAVGVSLAVYRMSRPPTFGERFERVLPRRFQHLRGGAQALELWARKRVPPMRLYMGDRQPGEEREAPRWERIGVRFAQAFGTAAASLLVRRVVGRLTPGR
ncbi:MAG: hypothetical protein ACREPA_11460 [Candidatus Dormibacteraceae bacterium]